MPDCITAVKLHLRFSHFVLTSYVYHWLLLELLSKYSLFSSIPDEFKGHSLLQAAREADMTKVKKTLALEIINFKHPQTHETALVSSCWSPFYDCVEISKEENSIIKAHLHVKMISFFL